jgi:hypothetical protein
VIFYCDIMWYYILKYLKSICDNTVSFYSEENRIRKVEWITPNHINENLGLHILKECPHSTFWYLVYTFNLKAEDALIEELF